MRQVNSFDENIRQINVLLVDISSHEIENIKTALKELGWNFRLISAKEENTINPTTPEWRIWIVFYKC
ncbi:MAG: hypothetical protein KCCBMMGE_00207 [Candidatus Methanoperedenaceae archaeon GB37]|nr:MAG: hypothetical protein KCCBMMGE_00207 [Candidatus Methanoperedenaceae archaeon GB37]CAD7778682.1 hypothetical protein DMNBHIDG_01855 [Candidatus Methanoperedenaceae archaeon GB37]